jgi:hypothetical protein
VFRWHGICPFSFADNAFAHVAEEKGRNVRTSIPHAAVLGESGEVTKASLNDLIRRALDVSAPKPCALEVYDSVTQRVLFLRDRQIYAAAEATGGPPRSATSWSA